MVTSGRGSQNVGLQGYRRKVAPFYYLHWWDLSKYYQPLMGSLGAQLCESTDY